MRLARATIGQLPAGIARFDYDRDAQAIGIVHFGIGAFTRAHQAWYTDQAMSAGETDWAICGVSLRSPAVSEQMNPQDGLYTLTERTGTKHTGNHEQIRLIGAVREVVFAPDAAEQLIARIAAPACRIVSFTVTEKGYARGSGNRLDMAAAENSFYPYLTDALALRMERGLPGIALLSCDNLPNNGALLKQLMTSWIAAKAPHLSDWFSTNCTVPSTMIDRIVPRAAPDDLALLAQKMGMSDQGAVFTERFSQWVVEDKFANGRPAWENHGVQMVEDCEPYETAKLRMLNGAHSLLAYCGLRKGYEFVHEAALDRELNALAKKLMRTEAAPTIKPAADQNLDAYADDLMKRFADPALRHRLDQIAMDGTQKIPQRWLDTALAHTEKNTKTPAIAEAFSAWIWHLIDGRFVNDPQGRELSALGQAGGKNAILNACFSNDPRIAIWPDYAALRYRFG